MSYGGAFITTQANIFPPKGTFVTVRFHFEKDEGRVEEVVTSRIIHTIPEVSGEGRLGSFGVKFEEPIEDVKEKLGPVFRVLL